MQKHFNTQLNACESESTGGDKPNFLIDDDGSDVEKEKR